MGCFSSKPSRGFDERPTRRRSSHNTHNRAVRSSIPLEDFSRRRSSYRAYDHVYPTDGQYYQTAAYPIGAQYSAQPTSSNTQAQPSTQAEPATQAQPSTQAQPAVASSSKEPAARSPMDRVIVVETQGESSKSKRKAHKKDRRGRRSGSPESNIIIVDYDEMQRRSPDRKKKHKHGHRHRH
jgi:hypothetical protein